MVSEEFQIISEGGLILHGRSWLPESPAEALVCLIHDLGGHSDQYKQMAEYFAGHRIAAFAVDLRGHGNSEGKRGDGSVASFLSDIQELVANARREYNDLPLFLIGQGFGGLFVTHYLVKMISNEISGAVLSLPRFQATSLLSDFRREAAAWLKYIYPSARFSRNEINKKAASLSHLRNDPMVHDKISAKLYFDIEQSRKLVIERAHLIEVPILIFDAGYIEEASDIEGLMQKISFPAIYKHDDIPGAEVHESFHNWIKKQL